MDIIPKNKKDLITFMQEELPTLNIDVGRPVEWDKAMYEQGVIDLHYYVWVYKANDIAGRPMHLLEFWYQRK